MGKPSDKSGTGAKWKGIILAGGEFIGEDNVCVHEFLLDSSTFPVWGHCCPVKNLLKPITS